MPKAVVVQDLTRVTFDHGGLLSLTYGSGSMVVAVREDDPRTRWRYKFANVQAARITTSDCFDYTGVLIDNKLSRRLVEVIGSSWLKALASELREHDPTATSMDKSRHFVLTFHEQVVEIAAWSVEAEAVQLRFVGGQWIE
ncbi:MAG: hypothetical protein NVS3B20_15420 [Polyangiales bacterium]